MAGRDNLGRNEAVLLPVGPPPLSKILQRPDIVALEGLPPTAHWHGQCSAARGIAGDMRTVEPMPTEYASLPAGLPRAVQHSPGGGQGGSCGEGMLQA